MSSNPHLEVAIQQRLGTLALDVSFSTSAPWTILFGPSGSGKSTILRAIAGLENPDSGRICIGGQTVFAGKISTPAHQRPARWSSQTAALFPRMTVQQNIAFGYVPTENRPVEAALEVFDLTRLARKRPAELSGGERQRASVARAAVGARGRLLLLDEPFTGLDAPVRDRLIASLRAWLGDTPIVSVTHDVAEAFQLNAEIVRIAEGRVIAQGTPAAVLAQERARLLTLLTDKL